MMLSPFAFQLLAQLERRDLERRLVAASRIRAALEHARRTAGTAGPADCTWRAATDLQSVLARASSRLVGLPAVLGGARIASAARSTGQSGEPGATTRQLDRCTC